MRDDDLQAILESIRQDDKRILETLRELQNDTVLIDLLDSIRQDDKRISEMIETLKKNENYCVELV